MVSYELTNQLVGDASIGTSLPEFILNASTPSTLSWTPIAQNLTDIGVTAFQVVVDDLLRLGNYTTPNITMDQVGLGGGWQSGDLDGGNHTFRLAVSLLSLPLRIGVGEARRLHSYSGRVGFLLDALAL